MRKPRFRMEGLPNWWAPTFIGLEIAISDGAPVFHAALVQRRRKSVDIQKWTLNAPDLQAALAGLDRNDPLYLIYTGKPVLIKPSMPDVSVDWHPVASQYLPGADPGAFSTLVWEPGSTGRHASLLRHQTISAWEQEVQAAGFAVHGFLMGPFAVRLLGLQGSIATQTGKIVLHSSGDVWEPGVLTQPHPVQIGAREVDSQAVPAIAVAVAGALQLPGVLAPLQGLELLPVVQSARLLKKIVWVGTIAALFFTFSTASARYYFNRQEGKMHLIKKRFESRGRVLDSLQQLQRQQNKLQQDQLLGGPSYLSYYTDRMVQAMPEGMALESLELFPSKEKKKRASEKEPQRFEQDRIMVVGTASNNEAYQQWVKSLKGMEWVSGVENLEYKDVPASGSSFKISIRTRL